MFYTRRSAKNRCEASDVRAPPPALRDETRARGVPLRAPAKQEMRRQAGVGSPPKGPKRDASPTNASPAAQRAAAAACSSRDSLKAASFAA